MDGSPQPHAHLDTLLDGCYTSFRKFARSLMKHHDATTVKIEVLLNADQLEQAFTQLPKTEQLRLFDVIERHTWAQRLDRVVTHIRQQAPKLSQEEIVRLCRDVRHERAQRARRS